jgi:hypothetical protein
MLNTAQIEVLDTIQGSSFLAIQVAIGVFKAHNPDLSQYKISVVRQANSVVVIFSDKNAQPGERGSSGGQPGFEVELDANTLRVLRSNFVR